MNWRRLRSSMGSSPEPAGPAYRTLRMNRKRPQVLGVDLNRSELSHLLISQVFLPRSVPNRHLQDALRTKRFFGTSVPNIALSLTAPCRFRKLRFVSIDGVARLGLVYGEQDWAPPVERERTRSLIPSVAICHNHCIEDDDEKAAQHQSCASVLRSPAHWHLRRRRPRSGSCPPTARDRSPPRIDNPGFAARGRRPRRGPGAARSPAAARSRHPR
jgi:hypothetical protein